MPMSMTMHQSHNAMPTLSLRAQVFKLLLRILRRKKLWAAVEGVDKGIQQARRKGPARPQKSLRQKAEVRVETIAGCEVYTLAPRGATSGERILYLHGGGYIRPITSFHWGFLEWLVLTRRATVVVPLYPLAPESTCQSTVQTVREIHDLAMQRVGLFNAFIGDSAGAGLCLAMCQDIKKTQCELPRRLVLISPFVDVTMKNPAIVETDKCDLMLGPVGTRQAGRLYAGDLPLDHPYVSPINADLRGFPAMQVFVATDDITGHDALLFAESARQAGAETEVHIGHGLMHVWPILPIKEADISREAINRFLQPNHQRP